MDCTIVNLYPGRLEEIKPGVIPNVFIIEGAKDKESFTVTHITDAKYQTDPVAGRPSIFVPILAEEIAHSIVNDFVQSKVGTEPGGKGPGIFVLKGTFTVEEVEKKFKAQLDRARAFQNQWFSETVQIADNDWAVKRSHLVIPQDAKWGAVWLGLNKEWNKTLEEMLKKTTKTCPGCAFEVPLAAIICRDCKTILDPERAKGLKMAVAG